MPKYIYKAVNAEGKYKKGKIFAQNEIDLESLIKKMSLNLISYQLEKLFF